MLYTIRHEETRVGFFEIEAPSKEEALHKFQHDPNLLRDFSYLVTINSHDFVVLEEE